TVRYTSRFNAGTFYRDAGGLRVSSLGLGTYLGGLDERADNGYTAAVATAVCGGVNFLDSAINYRHQRSERSIGAALSRLVASGGLGLARLATIAREEGGSDHHFRFIQLPFNLAMPEALTQRPEALNGQPASVLEAARELGITVVASATLLQSKLAVGLPDGVVNQISGLETDAQRAVQFTRSTPGI